MRASAGFEDAGDGGVHRLERGDFVAEAPATGGGNGVVARTPSGGRLIPFARDESGAQQTLEGRVERSFFDVNDVGGGALDVLRDAVAVHSAEAQRSKDEHVEGTGDELAWLW